MIEKHSCPICSATLIKDAVNYQDFNDYKCLCEDHLFAIRISKRTEDLLVKKIRISQDNVKYMIQFDFFFKKTAFWIYANGKSSDKIIYDSIIDLDTSSAPKILHKITTVLNFS